MSKTSLAVVEKITGTHAFDYISYWTEKLFDSNSEAGLEFKKGKTEVLPGEKVKLNFTVLNPETHKETSHALIVGKTGYIQLEKFGFWKNIAGGIGFNAALFYDKLRGNI